MVLLSNELKYGLLVLTIISMARVLKAQGQSKCDTICANDASCSAGKCILTQCSDSRACFKYCLNCAGVETCYAKGSTCEKAYNVVLLGSNSIKCSFFLALTAILFSTFLLLKIN